MRDVGRYHKDCDHCVNKKIVPGPCMALDQSCPLHGQSSQRHHPPGVQRRQCTFRSYSPILHGYSVHTGLDHLCSWSFCGPLVKASRVLIFLVCLQHTAVPEPSQGKLDVARPSSHCSSNSVQTPTQQVTHPCCLSSLRTIFPSSGTMSSESKFSDMLESLGLQG